MKNIKKIKNIKADQSSCGQKKVSEKLSAKKKIEKAGNSKISAAKRDAISQAINDVRSLKLLTTAFTPSMSDVNLFGHFTNAQEASAPLVSTITNVALSKNPHVLYGIESNNCQPFFCGQQSLLSMHQSLHNDLISKMNSQQLVAAAPPMEVNTTSDKLNVLQNNLAFKMANFTQAPAATQPVTVNSTPGDLLNIQQSLNVIQPSMLNNSYGHAQQFVFAEQTVTENTMQIAVPQVQKNVNNLSKTLQFSTSAQSEASNVSLSVTNSEKPIQLKNSTIKGKKRKAEEIVNNIVSAKPKAKKKKNKKQKCAVSQKKRLEVANNKNIQNFPEMGNPNPLLCAIVEEQYPNMPPLTNVHLAIVRNVIKGKIDELPFEGFAPKFTNSFIKSGVILVECADNQSKEWLHIALTNYSPEERIYLKVIPAQAVNQFYSASIFVPEETNAYDVLTRIQKQNPDISIKNWQYHSMIIVKENTPGIAINVGIPATSVAVLKEKQFKLFHAVDQVVVMMRDNVPF